MKRKIFFIILIIIFLSQINVEAAGVYLGSFTPQTNENFSFSIPVQNLEGEIITISTSDDYFRAETNKIAASNLKLVNRDNSIPLSSRELKIEKNSLLYNFSLNFQLNLKAEYKPGLYSNIIFLKDKNKILELEVVFEIRPWMEILNGAVQSAKIENVDNRTMELLSSGQQKILIRSNTNWKLKVMITEASKDNLSIRVAADSESRSFVDYKSDFIKLNEVETVIANGSNTAKLSSGQVEIFYQLRIEDFRKVNAGEKNYQINFKLE
ncbi:hypothetical protein [Halanaerobium sp. ST460_2HS_T2]|uniref:hypothetical protein n=1 Tax=Halanaerobium sp. ST460_2HS_T2 TaxID=2183914 RepID=UPI000DF3D2F9|nr:hypothetical protein [Halanaerobium sp. ST460_2HS_T2]RCW52336.1 hypothetical protein DFR80_13028 [Halanaerobium sp. ST460_2HS_T2]